MNSRQARALLRYGPPAEPGWRTCAQVLADRDAFPRWQADLTQWLRQEYDQAPPRTVAGYLLAWYLTIPGYLAGLLFHHERRVPSLRPADITFRTATPRPHVDAIAVTTPGFACLPDDPAAGTGDATVVPTEHALAAVLRGRFIAHAARFADVIGPQVRFGRHTLWAAATDALDNALWLAGRYGGDEGAGVLDAALVLADGPDPFTSASTLRPNPGTGPTTWTRRRESCCFHYLIDAGKGPCQTCPRLSRRFAGSTV